MHVKRFRVNFVVNYLMGFFSKRPSRARIHQRVGVKKR